MALAKINHTASWEDELKRSLRTARDLFEAGFISEKEIGPYTELLKRYPFLLPRYYANLIERENPHCPIRLQAIPRLEELTADNTFTRDPLGDLEHQPVPRITHRYKNRVLLHLTSICSMYCRFCFRKSLLNELSGALFRGEISGALAYLSQHTEIEEVVFSGGDPWMVSDNRLRFLLLRISEMPHISRVRFHTRVPVTFPMRVTQDLMDALGGFPFSIVVVIHFNHPKELTGEAAEVCHRIREMGMTLLNQSVLLRGVNDQPEILCELSRALFGIGILPYYLHHPDRAQGTRHFYIPVERGLDIYRLIRSELPGYLVPRYVCDVVGHPYKLEALELVPPAEDPMASEPSLQ